MPTISVIIPVYNAEKYLQNCINSIQKQTYRDYEVIIIDDGSTDESPLICDKLANDFPNILVYHKPNGGIKC